MTTSRSAWPVMIGAFLAVGSLALSAMSLVVGLVSCALWAGVAIFFLGARRRFPTFVRHPLRHPYPYPGVFGDDALEGPLRAPNVMLYVLAVGWICALLPVLMRPPSLSSAALGAIATPILALLALWLWRRQRPAAAVAARLLGGGVHAGPITGVVRAGAWSRHVHWFEMTSFAAGHSTSEGVEPRYTASSSSTYVAHGSPSFRSYGFVNEHRETLRVEVAGEARDEIEIDARHALFAAPRRRLPVAPAVSHPPDAHAYRAASVDRAAIWEDESIPVGSRVLVNGAWDGDARRFRGSAARPTLVFGVPPELDPEAVLRAELLHRRWPIAALAGLAMLTLAIALLA